MLAALSAKAQLQPLYSQYMFNGLAVNPAYAGSREVFSASALHRDQWTGMEGAPETQTLAAHTPLKKKVGLGIMLYHDKIGVTDQKGISLSYAYRLPLSKGKLSFGISGALSSIRSNWTAVTTVQNGDEVFSQDSPSSLAPNAGAGCYYYSQKFYAGLSVPALLTNVSTAPGKVSTTHDPSRYTVMLASGVLLPMGDVVFKPSMLVKYNSRTPVQVDINSNFYIKEHIEIGASYRTNDAIVGIIGYSINRQLKIGYAYDRTLSTIKNFSKGSHEFMLQYEFGRKLEAMSPRYF
jgi:type IX secretion system PorP/SprF family membrane protein